MARKCIYHSSLVAVSPFTLVVQSEQKPSRNKKDYYVDANVNGEDVYLTVENPDCGNFLAQCKGRTIRCEASGTRDTAQLSYVGEAAPMQPAQVPQQPVPGRQPAIQPAAAPVQTPPKAVPATVTAMRATELYYERTVNIGNYCSEKIGITLHIGEGVKAQDVLNNAIHFVESNLGPEVATNGTPFSSLHKPQT